MSRALLLVTALVTLSACVTRFPVAEGVRLTLPSASVLGTDRYATQLVTVRARGEVITFQANLEISAGTMVVVASDVVGTPLFSLSHADRTRVERYAPLEGAPPLQLVMADLMLVYAPVQDLSASLRGGTVRQVGLQRQVIGDDGSERIRIRYQDPDPWVGTVVLEHLERRYTLEIITVESGPL
jgi:Protein of unknown function (DUF3261)